MSGISEADRAAWGLDELDQEEWETAQDDVSSAEEQEVDLTAEQGKTPGLELNRLRLVYQPIWNYGDVTFMGMMSEHEILVEQLPDDLKKQIIDIVTKVERINHT